MTEKDKSESADLDARRLGLIRLLKDENEEVRQMAASALERLDGMSNLPLILEHYKKGDKAIRLRSIYALGKLGTEECMPPLIHALDNDKEEDVRAAAIRVLAEIKDPKTLPALILRLSDPSNTIQTMVAQALGNFRHRNLSHHLIPLLKRENKYLVMATLESLGKINAGDAVEEIIKLLDHTDPDVRKIAAKVLGEIQA
jgi:HEAT repeat protein